MSGGGNPNNYRRSWWLLCSNISMMIVWIRVLWMVVVLLHVRQGDDDDNQDNGEEFCTGSVSPAVKVAVLVSFLELWNCIVGFTKSHALHVFQFACIRAFMEMTIAPLLPTCTSWEHIFTVFFWSFGDTVRFTCFSWDIFSITTTSSSTSTTSTTIATNNSSRSSHGSGSLYAKSIRYTVGPILFPLGALGEMLMIYKAASTLAIKAAASKEDSRGYILLYLILPLWPIGFYFLMLRLLKQRRRFFQKLNPEHKKAEIKSI